MKTKVVMLVTVLGICGFAQAGLSDGLIASYTFDGDANDSSGSGYNGAVSGATLTTDRFGNENSAYSFDGENDYIEVADSEALRLANTDFTLSVWVNEAQRNSSYNAGILIKRGTEQADGWFTSSLGSAIGGELVGKAFYNVSGGGDPSATSSASMSLNSWHHLAITYSLSTGTASFYIDGVFDSSTSGITSPNSTTDSAMRIGADTSGSSYFFNGAIDDVRIYDRALNSTEVSELQAIPEPAVATLIGLVGVGALVVRRLFPM